MTRIAAAVAVALASLVSAAAAPAAVRMTHSLTIEGDLVNRWTTNDPRPCGVVGDGVLTVKFRTVSPVRVWPLRSPILQGAVGGPGAWIIGYPYGRNGLRDMPQQKVTGTVTRVDNTTQRPPEFADSPCDPPEVGKQGCGTVPLRGRGRSPTVSILRWSGRQMSAILMSSRLDIPTCNSGSATDWRDTAFVAERKTQGRLLLDMPRPTAFKRRRVVRVTGASRKRASDSIGDQVTTNDVTRKLTATFRRR